MNLIEKLGLEKCNQIVDGAPKGCEDVVISNQGKVIYFKNAVFGLAYHEKGTCWISANPDVKKHLIRLEDLRAALADHNSKPCLHGYDIACLICGFGTENGVRVWRKQIETDNVTDIRNHISPNTKAIEHE